MAVSIKVGTVISALMTGLSSWVVSSDSCDSDSVGVGVADCVASLVGVDAASSISVGVAAQPARSKDVTISVLISVIFSALCAFLCLRFTYF